MVWLTNVLQKIDKSIKEMNTQNFLDLSNSKEDCQEDPFREYCENRKKIEEFVKDHRMTVPLF